MNRRTFLSSTAAVAAVSSNGIAAVPRDGRVKVLIPEFSEAEIASLREVAPSGELVIPKGAEDLLKHAADADAIHGYITRDVVKAAKRLKWAQQPSAGVEGLLEIRELIEGDVILTNMQRIFAPEIADQAIGMLLSFTRALKHYVLAGREETWDRPKGMVFNELLDKTLLVVALGGIGAEIARRAYGFGMKVLATDPKVHERPLFVEELHKPDMLHKLLPRADVVASAVPLTPITRKMFGEKEFGLMKDGVILLNVSRGGVCDTDALIAALDRGKVSAAGLDVTDPEPLPKGHPLWKRNVIITPHTAGQSPEGLRRAFLLFRENLRRFVSGEMLLNIVDKRAGY